MTDCFYNFPRRKTEEGKGSLTLLKKLYIFSNEIPLPFFFLISIKIVHNRSLGLIFTWREKKSEIYIPPFRENSTSNWMSPKACTFIHTRKWRYTIAKYNSHYFLKNCFHENWKIVKSVPSYSNITKRYIICLHNTYYLSHNSTIELFISYVSKNVCNIYIHVKIAEEIRQIKSSENISPLISYYIYIYIYMYIYIYI